LAVEILTLQSKQVEADGVGVRVRDGVVVKGVLVGLAMVVVGEALNDADPETDELGCGVDEAQVC